MEVLSLQNLLKTEDTKAILNLLKTFKNPKNEDIELFLINKSIQFEKSSISSTHLMIDDEGILFGYFTIANRSLIVSKENLETMSKTQQKKLSNSGAILRNGDLMTSSFLLGQLGKNYSKDIEKLISGKELLSFAYNLLLKVKKIINAKYVWLECQNEPKLINFYNDFGFKILENITSEEGLKVMIMELK